MTARTEITDAIIAETIYADMIEDSEVVEDGVLYTLEDGRSVLVTETGEITVE